MYPNYAENTPPNENTGNLTLRASQAELKRWGMDGVSAEDDLQARNVAVAERVAAADTLGSQVAASLMVKSSFEQG